MGRLFDGPWLLIIIFPIIIAVIIAVVVSSVNKSKRSNLVSMQAGSTGQAPWATVPGNVEPHLYMQGLSHRSTATTFGVIGLFVLGIVFGPLALVQANKAEALGVKATAGKVLGWISVGFTIFWLIVFAVGMSRR